MKTSLLLLEYAPKRGTTQDDEVFIANLEDLEHFEPIISSFRSFFNKNIVPRKENLFVTNITSANQMDAGYLNGMRSISRWTTQYQHVELQEIASIITGGRLDRFR